GVISAIFAVLQCLDMHTFFSGIIYSFNGNRPYANLAQPNNLATLLILSLLSSIYLFEKKIISSFFLVPMSLITLFGVVLAQSRTSIIVCAFIVIYWLIKQVKKQNRFSHIHLALWVGIFILLSSNLASLNQW